MANRIIRDWSDSEKIDLLTYQAEVLFTRLLTKADDYGSYIANPKLIRGAVFPLRVDKVREADISRWLHELQSAGLIALYEADSKPYLRILNFGQRLRAMKSKYPQPEEWQLDATRGHPRTNDSRRQQHAADGGLKRSRNEVETETEEETEKKTPTNVGAKENADGVGSPTSGGKVVGSEKLPSKQKEEKPPPSSAAPPSTIVRDDKGVATCQELRKQLLDYRKDHPGKYEDDMYGKFLRYWSEPNLKGKPRWMTEKEKKNGRFDIPGRLATWKEKENASITSNANNRGNKTLSSRALAEPNYRGDSNVRKIEI